MAKLKKAIKPKVENVIFPFNYSGVRLRESMLKNQFDKMRQYYLDIPDDDILKGFRERDGSKAAGKDLGGWYTGNAGFLQRWKAMKKPTNVFNTFGQWLGAFARMYRVTGDSAILEKLEYLLGEWGKTIEPDGYFFYGTNPNARHYEFEKIVGGLADVYEYAGNKEAINYLRRITDWAIRNLNRRRIPAGPHHFSFTGGHSIGGEDSDTEWYTLSENLYRAYLLTGESIYRDFAKTWHYDSYWGDLADNQPCMTGLHAYSHVNTLSSAAMAYAVTAEKSYLNTIVNAYEILQNRQVFATGGYGPGECMANQYGSLGNSLWLQKDSFESPCGSWAGFKLARYLISFTGQARYGDWIEKLLYNGIGAALPMEPEGRTYYYSDYRVTGGEKKYNADAWPCCSGTYPLAVTDYHNIIYFKDKNSLYINIFVPSEIQWHNSGENVTLVQDTDFPKTGRISLRIRISGPTEFSLKFRIPAWVRGNISVKVNNEPFSGQWNPGVWGEISRRWNDGDSVDIELPLDLCFIPIDSYRSNLVALMYGPIVLVADKPGVLRGDTENPSSWILPVSDRPGVFQIKGKPYSQKFKPYFSYQEGERYYMYHKIKKTS